MKRLRRMLTGVLSRTTGISTPIGGVSWRDVRSERDGARAILAFLEDRRVLYDWMTIEEPTYVSRSVLEIRGFLTTQAGQFEPDSYLRELIDAMREHCRAYLSASALWKEANEHQVATDAFHDAIRELRSGMRESIQRMSDKYHLKWRDPNKILRVVDVPPPPTGQ